MGISLGLNAADLRRIAWTFAMAAVASYVATGGSVSKAAVVAAISAGLSAVKNYLLGPDSPIK